MYTVCGHIMSCRQVEEEEGYSSMYQSINSHSNVLLCAYWRGNPTGFIGQTYARGAMKQCRVFQTTELGWLDDVGWFPGSNVSGFHQFLQIFDFSSFQVLPW